MKLYFLRHGEADWSNWTKSDDERPLTERGKEEMHRVAAFLEHLEVKVDRIVTSSLPRARQTAEIAAQRLDAKLVEEKSLSPGFGIRQLKRLLEKYPDKDLMIVGHEPDFTQTIAALTGGSVKLSKAGVALVDVDVAAKGGKLLWLFPPKFCKKFKPR